MSEPDELPPPRPRRRRRWLLLLVVPLTLGLAGWVYLYSSSDQRLKRAVAEADRLDPHWRLDDVLAERADIPDEDNGALIVIAVKSKMPSRWPAWDLPPSDGAPESEPSLGDSLRELKPNEALTPRERSAMRGEMERAAAAIQEARKLADRPRGRFQIAYSRDYISTLMPNIQDARQTAQVLSYDALFRAQSGDLDGAVVSCRALVNNGRSLGDEPTLIAQLVRMAIRAIAAGQAERTVGQGEPDADGLAGLQRALEEEAEEPLFQYCMRGERAGMDRLMQSLQDGGTSVKQMQGLLNSGSRRNGGWAGEELTLYLPGTVTNNRAALLERMNRMVEISKLPPGEQAARLDEQKATFAKEPLLVRELLLTATEKIAEAERRTRGLLRCTAAGLAAERYRRKYGRWPEKLDDLKGEFLRQVPLDPYDGRPLRYRKDGEGIVIYAIWKDGTDDGGDRTTLNTYKDGTDVGFRLWDVDKRRRPRK